MAGPGLRPGEASGRCGKGGDRWSQQRTGPGSSYNQTANGSRRANAVVVDYEFRHCILKEPGSRRAPGWAGSESGVGWSGWRPRPNMREAAKSASPTRSSARGDGRRARVPVRLSPRPRLGEPRDRAFRRPARLVRAGDPFRPARRRPLGPVLGAGDAGGADGRRPRGDGRRRLRARCSDRRLGGGTMCMLFAATYPERTSALVLCGAMARSTWAEDYPWAPPKEAAEEASTSCSRRLGSGRVDRDLRPEPTPRTPRRVSSRLATSARPRARSGSNSSSKCSSTLDVRDALPLIQAPTLVLHRRDDRAVNVRAGALARRADPGQPLRRARGRATTAPGPGDTRGARRDRGVPDRGAPGPEPDRVLATVLFTDIVDSTRSRPSWATAAGASCSSATRRWSATTSSGSGAARSRRRATGSWRPSTARPGRSSARGRSSATGALDRDRGPGRDAHR